MDGTGIILKGVLNPLKTHYHTQSSLLVKSSGSSPKNVPQRNYICAVVFRVIQLGRLCILLGLCVPNQDLEGLSCIGEIIEN